MHPERTPEIDEMIAADNEELEVAWQSFVATDGQPMASRQKAMNEARDRWRQSKLN